MNNEFSVVVTTFSNQEVGDKLISTLLGRKLAACIQVMPVSSHYTWEGKVTHDAEVLALIKSKTTDYDAIESCIAELHDYKVPEIIRLPIADGSDSYLSWIREVTK